MRNGDSLNAELQKLLDPIISESAFRTASLPFDTGSIRRIRFKIPDEAVSFSLERLTMRGKGQWVVAFQGSRFQPLKDAYERALDRALDESIGGKVDKGTIEAVGMAVDDLRRKLDQTFNPSDHRHFEARRQLDEMKRIVELFKHHKVQKMIGEMETFAGTTVYDLIHFMKSYKVGFAPADNEFELGIYPDLYDILVEQREQLLRSSGNAGQ